MTRGESVARFSSAGPGHSPTRPQPRPNRIEPTTSGRSIAVAEGQKLRASILKSCEKRSVGVQAVDDVVGEIESQLYDRTEKEISSEELGKIVMEHLQKLDPVAYVRFASVYRKFKDVGQFVEEVKGLQSHDKAKTATAGKPKAAAKAK